MARPRIVRVTTISSSVNPSCRWRRRRSRTNGNVPPNPAIIWRNDARPSNFAAYRPDDLLDRGIAIDHREQTRVENRLHAGGCCCPLDRRMVGSLENQPVELAARKEKLSDGAAAAVACTAALRTPRGSKQG